MTYDQNHDEQVKEVYARFGLAVYYAQVLEQGIINALAFLDLIPTRIGAIRSQEEWSSVCDAFMGRPFKETLGGLIKALRRVAPISPGLEELLTQALDARNRLAHSFFRERAEQFLSQRGREEMLLEVDECRELFKTADAQLGVIVRPLEVRWGLTDEVVEKAIRRVMGEPIE